MTESTETNSPRKADVERVDEYDGKYKDRSQTMSEAEKFGTNQLPVQNDPLPAKGLRQVGG